MNTIVTNMTGSVWRLLVQAGDEVEKGQDVVILESMKMEIPIAAEVSGKVKKIKINEGDFVSDGDVLIELE
ncbi:MULTISPECIES: acetyl-CoA carboxylase biotin carboxyl carrier protein subunit [Metabacillus]|jgi:acetyl-CoA carboxylase biotin carboxyl carrier protein|uniref:Acetyl-CoA carboxylase biotin carboxyl carrier protein subunit n=3 Tax=Metabacillus TaxID=2675233 RepID=A0A179SN22_9BACI|nr:MULTISPECIES: acetyl-CoA carboxylase biotin carboxyl carrier protein subunit [Metabacillus]OAS82881.1 acetyl-CoA carboxylase biotin carboxyl carrier protein subunit [Metabacillus litoralis]QNF30327.1 acetyl-CoA carboxylase biotin carboxyl carrier protein subunit [Metabacillus sp. KUDC1714]